MPSGVFKPYAGVSTGVLVFMKTNSGGSFDTFSDEDLSRLAMPVLVLLGGRDVTMDSGRIERRFEEHVPDAEVVVYPDARHYLGDQSVPIAQFLRRALNAGAKPHDTVES